MELIKLISDALKNIKPEILIGFFTFLIAFLSWIIKGLIEKPLANSKDTFNRFTEKRIEILTEIKTRLLFISYFPDENDSKLFKEQLQEIILKDGKVAYLSKELLAFVIKIAIEKTTNEKLLIDTINLLDVDMTTQISKIQDEIKFYNKFSNLNPTKRIIGFLLLSMEYTITFAIMFFIIFKLLFIFSLVTWGLRLIIIIDFLLLIFLINKWFKR